MSEIKNQKRHQQEEHSGGNLTGTLFSVSIIGVVILVMWFGAYGLYLAR